MTTTHIATASLAANAAPDVNEWVQEGLENGTKTWIADPDAFGVYGLTDAEQGYPTRRGQNAPVYVIFYADEEDFEVTDSGMDQLLARYEAANATA